MAADLTSGQDIGSLDIAMDNALVMKVSQALQNLHKKNLKENSGTGGCLELLGCSIWKSQVDSLFLDDDTSCSSNRMMIHVAAMAASSAPCTAFHAFCHRQCVLVFAMF